MRSLLYIATIWTTFQLFRRKYILRNKRQSRSRIIEEIIQELAVDSDGDYDFMDDDDIMEPDFILDTAESGKFLSIPVQKIVHINKFSNYFWLLLY